MVNDRAFGRLGPSRPVMSYRESQRIHSCSQAWCRRQNKEDFTTIFDLYKMASANNGYSSASEESLTFYDEDYDVEIEEELEGDARLATRPEEDSEYDSEEGGPYEGEPLADEEYIENYNLVVREQAREEEQLTRRFEGTEYSNSRQKIRIFGSSVMIFFKVRPVV